MTASSMPTVDEKKPTDQKALRQATFLITGKRWWISRLLFALIFPKIADTARLGGITAIRLTWPTLMLRRSTSTSWWNS